MAATTRNLASKLVLITGGNSGVGYEAARQLLVQGHKVVIACRDAARGQDALNKLRRESSNVELLRCDLNSFSSVRSFADDFLKSHSSLDVLVCNAACISAQPQRTADGHDVTLQANHLGHHLLVHLLLPALLRSDQGGRIVCVSSELHKRVTGDMASPSLLFEKPEAVPSGMQAYSLSKLYNIWFAMHLASQLPKPLVCNAVSPGRYSSHASANYMLHRPTSARCMLSL